MTQEPTTKTIPAILPAYAFSEQVYGRHFDTAGNYHYFGTFSGEHVIKAEKRATDERFGISFVPMSQFL